VTDPHADSGDAAETGTRDTAETESGSTGSTTDDTEASDTADVEASPETDPETATAGIGENEEVDPEAVMTRLVEVDALVADGDELGLTDSFREALDARIGSLRAESDDTLAERAAAVTDSDVTVIAHEGKFMLTGDRRVWLTRAIALAETAAASELRERGVDDDVSRGAARPLRMFLDACPVCDGPIEDTTLGACRDDPDADPELDVRACADCDAIIFADQR